MANATRNVQVIVIARINQYGEKVAAATVRRSSTSNQQTAEVIPEDQTVSTAHALCFARNTYHQIIELFQWQFHSRLH